MKIINFYIDRATYKASDDSGHEILVEIDYWNNNYHLSGESKELEDYARKLLREKHRVNFVHKMSAP